MVRAAQNLTGDRSTGPRLIESQPPPGEILERYWEILGDIGEILGRYWEILGDIGKYWGDIGEIL